MPGTELRHLAVIAEGVFDPPHGGVAAALARAADTAADAFALAPALRAFSFVAPGIDRRLAAPETAAETIRDCQDAAPSLAAAAAALGASLRLCGRVGGLGGALGTIADAPRQPAAREILWFLRYGGRDEIARAASRFLRANPGRALADGELDAWLDTAGTPDPDLIVLAGGELEVRDALLWQGSYAELWHTPLPWPRFSGAELRRALADFAARQRRFGK